MYNIKHIDYAFDHSKHLILEATVRQVQILKCCENKSRATQSSTCFEPNDRLGNAMHSRPRVRGDKCSRGKNTGSRHFV